MASIAALMASIGEETGGEEFLRRVEEAIFDSSRLNGERYKEAKGISQTQTEVDCLAIGELCDKMDNSLANFWDGYVEKTPKAFEKRILTCPVAEALSAAPVVCERFIASGARGSIKALNPKANIRFTELLPKGDDVCRYRVEIEE